MPILSRVERIRSLLILCQLKNESLQVLEFLDFATLAAIDDRSRPVCYTTDPTSDGYVSDRAEG